jgi:hypothetical protein
MMQFGPNGGLKIPNIATRSATAPRWIGGQ